MSQRALLLTLPALLLACSGDPFAPSSRCDSDRFAAVYTESPRDCACLSGLITQALDFDQQLYGATFDTSATTLWIRDAFSDDHADGFYTPGDARIVTTRNLDELPHEGLHAYAVTVLGRSLDSELHHAEWDPDWLAVTRRWSPIAGTLSKVRCE
jgi:hypothetical protein